MKKPIQKKKHNAPARPEKKKDGSEGGMAQLLKSDLFLWILFGLVLITVFVVRSRFIGMPLERDEGEYAYFGQLILNGVPPYTEAYNMKLPGIYYMYALIMGIFGQDFQGIHTGFVVMNAGTMVFLFLALRKLFSPAVGMVTAGFFGLMAMSNNLLGFAAHATQFAVFYLAIALFFFAQFQIHRKWHQALLVGVMMGMAFLMKQQAVYFILFGGVIFLAYYLLEPPLNWKNMIVNTCMYSVGVFVPYLIVVLMMAASGTFDKFWFWTVQYASKYASGLPWEQGKDLLDMTFAPIWEEHKWIWYLAIAGAALIFVSGFTWKQKAMALLLFVFGALATTPGFYFRQHYFVVVLPAVGLLAALGLEWIGKWIAEKTKLAWVALALPLVVFFIIFNQVTSKGQFYYKPQDPVWLCKAIYGTNPFIESLEIAKYIRENSSDTDKVAVLGSEPQIPFYAGRRSATGHIYTYGLMEIHEYNVKMQEEMIAEIEADRPKYLVFVNVPFSWLSKPDSPMKIFEWYNKYSQENYEVVGLVDIPDQGPSQYYWNADARRNPVHKNAVWVFRRKA